jgi:hypothetical protein
VVDITGLGTTGGTLVQQWTYWGGANQKFMITPTGDGYYYITDSNSGMDLNVPGASTSEGVQLIIWPHTPGATNAEWSFTQNGDGTFTITNRNSGLVMDDQWGGTSNGTPVQQWPSNGTGAQKWSIPGFSPGTPPPQPPPPPPPPPSGTTYVLTNQASGLVVDITGLGTTGGTLVQQWTYWGGANQKFMITPTGDGYYYITDSNSGMDLNVPGASTSPGVQLIIWPHTPGAANAEWAFTQNGDGTFTITNRNSGLVMDDQWAGTSNGTPVQQWPSNGTAAQKWSIPGFNTVGVAPPPSSGGSYVLTNQDSSLALDVQYAGTTAGTPVWQYTPNGTVAQNWQITPTGDGFYYLTNPNSGMDLNVPGASTSPGTTLIIWTHTPGATNAEWSITHNSDGTFTLINRNSGLALDDQWGGTAVGTPVQQWTPNGTGAQKWSIPGFSVSAALPAPRASSSQLVIGGNSTHGFSRSGDAIDGSAHKASYRPAGRLESLGIPGPQAAGVWPLGFDEARDPGGESGLLSQIARTAGGEVSPAISPLAEAAPGMPGRRQKHALLPFLERRHGGLEPVPRQSAGVGPLDLTCPMHRLRVLLRDRECVPVKRDEGMSRGVARPIEEGV